MREVTKRRTWEHTHTHAHIYIYIWDMREDKLPEQNEGRRQYRKSGKLQRNKTHAGNGQKYKVT